MPPPSDDKSTGGRLTGIDVRNYFESFTERFLKGKIRYNMEILNIRRHDTDANGGDKWILTINDINSGVDSELLFDKVVLCTGVSAYHYPVPAFSLSTL
jgi:dimethylaniline monooxygenase (N-oxide forming)